MLSQVLTGIAAAFGGTVALVAAAAWLTRTIVSQFLARDIEKFKHQLGLEAQEFRVELERQSVEHGVRFRRIDEKVADALSEMYERLHRLHSAVASLVSPVEFSGELSKEEKLKLAQQASREC